MNIKYTVLALVLAGSLSATAAPKEYTIDNAHSSIGFSVTHMVISQVKGDFSKFTGSVIWDDAKIASSSIAGSVEVFSLSTKNLDRDKHLLSEDFFYERRFPNMTFKTTSIKKKKNGKFEITGDLTIRGVTKSVKAPLVVTKEIKDPWGKLRRGFTTELTINRKDFGLNWNKALDNGGLVVDDKVAFSVSIEAVQK